MSENDVAAALNRIVAVCRDGIEFYEQAAGKVEDPEIRDIFRNMAKVRRETIGELAPFVTAEDEEVSVSGTVAGTTHRLLSEIQASLSSDQTMALVSQLELTEERTVEELKSIVDQRLLPDPVWEILGRKVEVFRATLNQVKALKEALG